MGRCSKTGSCRGRRCRCLRRTQGRDREGYGDSRGDARRNTGEGEQVGRARRGLPNRLDERVGGLAINAVAVLVKGVTVPVLNCRRDGQSVGACGGLSGERERELVVVGAGDRCNGQPSNSPGRAGKRRMRGLKVAGLISSLKLSVTELRPALLLTEPSGRRRRHRVRPCWRLPRPRRRFRR